MGGAASGSSGRMYKSPRVTPTARAPLKSEHEKAPARGLRRPPICEALGLPARDESTGVARRGRVNSARSDRRKFCLLQRLVGIESKLALGSGQTHGCRDPPEGWRNRRAPFAPSKVPPGSSRRGDAQTPSRSVGNRPRRLPLRDILRASHGAPRVSRVPGAAASVDSRGRVSSSLKVLSHHDLPA